MKENKRPRIDHILCPSAPSMAKGRFLARTLYGPSSRCLRNSGKRMSPDPFINVSFGLRHHYSPIDPAGKVGLQPPPQFPPRTASSKLDSIPNASASASFLQPSSKTEGKPGAKQRQVRTCSLCNEPGHNMLTCPRRPCIRCQQIGHVKTYCDVAKVAAS